MWGFYSGINWTIWLSTYIDWTQYAAPIFWIILGIFIFFHGLITFINPPETYRLEVEVNGKRSSSNIFLRKFLIFTINIVCGITGMITMVRLPFTIGPLNYWPAWNIVGLFFSILLLIFTFLAGLSWYLQTRNIIDIKLQNSGLNIETYLASIGELLSKHLDAALQIIPLPTLAVLKDLDIKLNYKKDIVNKPAHILFIALAMFTSLGMFSAQLYDQAIAQEKDHSEPDGTFAKSFLRNMILGYNTSDRKVIILISTPVTFLLCAVLLALLRGTNVLRIILSGLISLGVGIFFCLFSVDTVQMIIMLGTNLSTLSYILKCVTMMPVPLLAATFIALAYSNFTQIQQKTEEIISSKFKTHFITMFLILSIVLIVLSLIAMISSNIVIMSTVQGFWNSTKDHSNDKECQNDDMNDYGYNDYYRQENIIKNNSSESKPDKCFTKILDRGVQDDFTFFSISQIMLTECLLFLSIFIITTGKKISMKYLCLPGFLLFYASSATVISYFFAIFNYDLQTNGIPFFILNGTISLSAVVLGFRLFCAGITVLISFIAFLFRIILLITALCIILILVSLQLLFKLTMELSQLSITKKVKNGNDLIAPEY